MPRYGPGQSGPAPKQAAPKYKAGRVAAGGAVLRRQTFQPENRKQQAGLHADVAAEANRLEHVHQRQTAQAQARALYKQGKRKKAIKLAQTAGLGTTVSGFGKPSFLKRIEQVPGV